MMPRYPSIAGILVADSHSTHALRRWADLATVRDTSGHASIATTSRYLHARPEKSSGDYFTV